MGLFPCNSIGIQEECVFSNTLFYFFLSPIFFILLCSYLGVFNLHVDFPVGVHIMTFARVDTISLIL